MRVGSRGENEGMGRVDYHYFGVICHLLIESPQLYTILGIALQGKIAGH
jgi:hypothetical protein